MKVEIELNFDQNVFFLNFWNNKTGNDVIFQGDRQNNILSQEDECNRLHDRNIFDFVNFIEAVIKSEQD